MKHEELRRLNEETQRRLLTCGGAAGHLQHVFDNHELTFAEIKEILSNSAEGHLEKVSEKADGINVVFSWNVAENQLKVARTGSDISRGGMNADELAKKFFGRGNVEAAFNSAFKILREAIGSLSPKTQALVFGPNANLWYSSEIIYTDATNTINYDSNNIVFHQWPVFKVTEDGVEQTDDASGVAVLEKNINQMQSAVSQKDWQVRGPSMVRLKKLSDGTILSRALSEIQQAMSSVGMNDGNTVYDYMMAKMHEEIVDLDLPPKVAKAVEARAMGVPNAPTVNDIKKTTPKELHSKIADVVRAGPELQKKFIEPIETAIHRFAIEVLRGLHSTMIAQSDAEVARLRAQLSKAIKAIETSGSEAAMEVLKREMQRLGAVDNLNAPMEGIVFFYKGQAYKYVGSFAPAHQIMALFKYGRKGIPKMDIGENYLRESLYKITRDWESR